MTRYRVHRCACGCNGYTVVDRVLHRAPFGTFVNLWNAQRAAEAANGHQCPPQGEDFECDGCGAVVIVVAA